MVHATDTTDSSQLPRIIKAPAAAPKRKLKAHVFIPLKTSIQLKELPYLGMLFLAILIFGLIAFRGQQTFLQQFIYPVHVLTAILLSLLISRKYSQLESTLFGILFLSFPLFTDMYPSLETAYSNGINVIINNELILFFTVSLLGLTVYETGNYLGNRYPDGPAPTILVNPIAWTILGIVTAILFRTSLLGLPLFCFTVAILQSLRMYSRRLSILLMLALILVMFPVMLGLLNAQASSILFTHSP